MTILRRHSAPDLVVQYGSIVSVGYLKQICAAIDIEDSKGTLCGDDIQRYLQGSILSYGHDITFSAPQDNTSYELMLITTNHKFGVFFKYYDGELYQFKGTDNEVSMPLPDDVSYLMYDDCFEILCDEETKMLIRLSMS